MSNARCALPPFAHGDVTGTNYLEVALSNGSGGFGWVAQAESEKGMRTRLLRGALITALVVFVGNAAWAVTDRQVQEAVTEEVDEVLSDNGTGGAAVVVRVDGRTLFFNFGKA